MRREIAAAVAGCLVSATILLLTHGKAAHAYGLVALGGVVAIAASRGASRGILGVALLAVGAAALDANPAGGAVLGVTGLFVAFRGGRWPALGARYEAPREHTERDTWEAFDRGDDPTA